MNLRSEFDDEALRIGELADDGYRRVRELRLELPFVRSLAWSPDGGSFLVSGSDVERDGRRYRVEMPQ